MNLKISKYLLFLLVILDFTASCNDTNKDDEDEKGRLKGILQKSLKGT